MLAFRPTGNTRQLMNHYRLDVRTAQVRLQKLHDALDNEFIEEALEYSRWTPQRMRQWSPGLTIEQSEKDFEALLLEVYRNHFTAPKIAIKMMPVHAEPNSDDRRESQALVMGAAIIRGLI